LAYKAATPLPANGGQTPVLDGDSMCPVAALSQLPIVGLTPETVSTRSTASLTIRSGVQSSRTPTAGTKAASSALNSTD
jgi:hypothetical protein